MRPHGVEVLAPGFDDDLRLTAGAEPLDADAADLDKRRFNRCYCVAKTSTPPFGELAQVAQPAGAFADEYGR